jgi:hypothetical protein
VISLPLSQPELTPEEYPRDLCSSIQDKLLETFYLSLSTLIRLPMPTLPGLTTSSYAFGILVI